MLLGIDVGNTNAVFAVFEGTQILDSWRLHTSNGRSADEYAVFLSQALALQKLSFAEIDAVVVCSVVPETDFHMGRFCKKYIHVEPVFINKNNVGINIDIDRPDDVGADRLINAVAAKAHYGAPSIVIDFGTSTNFDIVNAKGDFCGGVLAPGVQLSIDALHKAASKLPKVSISKPPSVIGQSTVHAMRSGIYHGYKGLIENITKGICEELGQDASVIATGGLAGLFIDDCPFIDHLDHDLTLKGLYEVYKGMK